MPGPVYCTKIASRLARTYTDKHGLKDLAREVLGVDLSKQQQFSDWGADELTDAQVAYAASDVLHLHALKDGSTPCWRGNEPAWPPPVSASCPTGSGSIWPAGPPRISLLIRNYLVRVYFLPELLKHAPSGAIFVGDADPQDGTMATGSPDSLSGDKLGTTS